MDALYWIADAIVRFLASMPGYLAFLYLVVVAVPVTLLHELGHAVAARRLIGGDVHVSVGTAGKLAEVRLGQVVVVVNGLLHPGRFDGVAQIDATRATARDVVLIALAGPAASLAGTVLTACAFSVTASGVLHGLLWAATLTGAIAVLNLVPLTLQERRDGPLFRTDGRLALDAWRVARALR